MEENTEMKGLFASWWNTAQYPQYLSQDLYQEDGFNAMGQESYTSDPTPFDFSLLDDAYWDLPELDSDPSTPWLNDSSFSRPSTPPSPIISRATKPRQSTKSKSSNAKTEVTRETEESKRVSRKAQNRAAQQAHRERKKRLIEELWIEIHTLRNRNSHLTTELKAKMDMLDDICQQFGIGQPAIRPKLT